MASLLLLLLLGWFLVLASMVFYRLLTGDIATRGLLCELGGDAVSPERVQMLVGTMVALSYYVTLTLSTDDPTTLPSPPVWVVALFGGSQSLYLAGKWVRRPGA